MARGLAGQWLSIYRELGDSPDMAFGRIAPDGGSVEWTHVPHGQADGIGALVKLLREHGYTIEHVPRGRPARGTGWWSICRSLFTKLPARGPRVPWADFDASVPVPKPTPAWTIFTAEQTAALEDVAMTLDVSLNSLLLSVLNRVIDPLLSDRYRPRIWMVPVNMRGVIGRRRRHGHDERDDEESNTANNVSHVGCRIPANASPQQVHAAIKEQLRRGAHLAAWWKMQAVSWLGRKLMTNAVRQNRENPRYWTGLFSNVGEWSPPGGPDGVAWCAGPPTPFDMAIGGVVMIWRGRLTMTFNIHPGIRDSQAKAQQVIDDWKRELLQLLPSSPSERTTLVSTGDSVESRTL